MENGGLMVTANTLPTVLLIVDLCGVSSVRSATSGVSVPYIHPSPFAYNSTYASILPHVDDIHVHGLERRVVACNRQIFRDATQ